MHKTIDELAKSIKTSHKLSESEKKECLAQVETIRHELSDLEHAHADKAKHIATKVHKATHSALKTPRNADDVELTSTGLERSIEEFEVSHPRLYETVKAWAIRLTGLGV